MLRIALAAAAMTAMMAAPQPAAAGGTALWCAVVTLGPGDTYEDCRYPTFEACYPNVLAGNRGFCNLNARYQGPVEPAKRRVKRAPKHPAEPG